MILWLVLAISFAIAIAVLYYRMGAERLVATKAALALSNIAPASENASSPVQQVSFQSEGTISLNAAIYTLAFSVPHFDYQILGPHLEVLNAAKAAVTNAVNDASYFPRKPALLPKLLRALNTGDSSREDIVRLILQDPVLAGNVLKRANSAFYRQGEIATESVDRAVVILGSEGLRSPVATAIMQPVFLLPRGFFDQFAPVTWELAQRTAVSAETYGRINKAGDSFVAHLLGLIGGLGRIVLFRLTLDKYRAHNILPRAEVFIRVMIDHEHQLTRAVANAWELSPAFLSAIDAQREQVPPHRMTPLAQTLYYANLCGALAVLCKREKHSEDGARILLTQHGLNAKSFASMWPAAVAEEP